MNGCGHAIILRVMGVVTRTLERRTAYSVYTGRDGGHNVVHTSIGSVSVYSLK